MHLTYIFGAGTIATVLNDQVTPERSNTRSRIVEAARELFWTQGFEATGLKDILRKAEANSGSLYYFFKSKHEVLLAVLDWYLQNLEPCVLRPAYDRTDDPVERIFAILGGYRMGLEMTGFTKGCPVGNLAIEVDQYPPARAKIAENFTNWVAAIAECLERAAERLPPDLNRGQLARFVLTVMEGAMMQARAYRSLEPFDSAVAQLRDYFRRLLAVKTTKAETREKANENA